MPDLHDSAATAAPPAPVREAGERSAAATTVPPAAAPGPLVFFLVIVGLGVLAALAMLVPPRRIAGLAADPDVAAAIDRLRGRAALQDAGMLRFEPALLGAAPTGAAPADPGALALAERHLAAALRRRPFDPRVRAALAALELSAGRLVPAERHYRAALDLAPEFGEARLGLGVVLAIRAEREPEAARARGWRLRALAQFQAVPEEDSGRGAALFDGAVVLSRDGRRDEAQRWARAYWARDPDSRWAEALRAALVGARAD